jgi:hypothetical protein
LYYDILSSLSIVWNKATAPSLAVRWQKGFLGHMLTLAFRFHYPCTLRCSNVFWSVDVYFCPPLYSCYTECCQGLLW